VTDPARTFWLRRASRRTFLGSSAAATLGGAAFYVAGCSSSDDGGDAPDVEVTPPGEMTTSQPIAGTIDPRLLTREFVAGKDNRFLIGLLDGEGRLVKNADVHLRFFKIGGDGQTGTFRGEGDMTYQELSVEGAHVHDGGGGQLSEDTTPFYSAVIPFDEAGRWGFELEATPQGGGTPSKIQVPFDVRDAPMTPADGTAPPASRNDTAASNPNVASLCSRDPACELHDVVIGDALGKRPLVVQFSTPAYCQTRFCGPVLEVLLKQAPGYRDRIDFVHIEVYRDFSLQQYREAVTEWGLPGEPYTFFVGSDGLVKSRLEAIFTEDELTQHLDGLLS
jgi:hypothetical protein